MSIFMDLNVSFYVKVWIRSVSFVSVSDKNNDHVMNGSRTFR